FHRRFFCRLRTRLRFSPDSLPVDNPRFEGAQEEPDYVEVGQRLVLEVTPQDLSAIQIPIEIIRWKFNNDLVVDRFHSNPVKYYGRFKARTHLDVSSLVLAIEPVSSADGGKFHLETGKGPVRTFDVRVIKSPPTPEIILKNDENRSAMQCSVDTQDLGPVTYQWRPYGGVWTDGEELKNMNTSHRSFFCRLRTRLRFSPDSLPVDNPRFVGEAPSTPEIILKPLECDENQCAMQCSVDTQDLGPVTYQWKPDDGVWTDGEELKNMTRFHKHFFCRLRTRLRFSPDSLPVDNPRFEEINPGLNPGAIFGIVIAVIAVLVVIAAVAFIKFYPEHTVSKRLLRLKNSVIRPPIGPAVEAPAEAHKGQVELHGGPDGPAPNGPTKEAQQKKRSHSWVHHLLSTKRRHSWIHYLLSTQSCVSP
ncbi:hypothetical protein NHX12_015343, partial [Muraenolepis orangiensis]